MSECLISRRGGTGIPPSVAYPIVAILTQSGTWTVLRSGTYRVTCIGSGGKAYMARTPSSASYLWVYGGGGGGGIAESILNLSKSQQITITVDEAISSFDNMESATAGNDAPQTSTIYSEMNNMGKQLGGSGGTATGGNIGNYDGYAGYINNNNYAFVKTGGGTSEKSKYGTGELAFQIHGGTSAGDVPSGAAIEYSMSSIQLCKLFPTVLAVPPYGLGGTACARGQLDIIAVQFNGAVIIEQIK